MLKFKKSKRKIKRKNRRYSKKNFFKKWKEKITWLKNERCEKNSFNDKENKKHTTKS